MNVWVGFKAFVNRIVVDELVAEVVAVGDVVGVVGALPELSLKSLKFLAYSEGEPALDQLGAAFDGNVWCWSEEDEDVVRCQDEVVELEFTFTRAAVFEEFGDEKFGDGVTLKDVATLVGDGRECVGLGFEAHGMSPG